MVEKMDKWCDRLWIYFMCAVGVATAIYLGVNWRTLPLGAKAGAFGAIIMPLHVIEEWIFPGGLHYIYNILFGSKSTGGKYLDRYPMSRFTDMITNVGLVVFPLIFMALACVADLSAEMAVCMLLFSLLEVVAHTVVGIYSLRRYRSAGKRTIYDPGFGTSYILFLPTAIYIACNLPDLTVGNWVGGIAALAIMSLCCVPLQETPLKKWVMKQKGDAFAFKSPKYYAKFSIKDRNEAGKGESL